MAAKKKATKKSTSAKDLKQIAAVQKQVVEALKPSLTPAGKINYKTLKASGTPLAEVLDVVVRSKTSRDDPRNTAKDVARLVAARQSTSAFAKSIDALADMLSKVPAPKRKKGPR
jgi:hypothetical protein